MATGSYLFFTVIEKKNGELRLGCGAYILIYVFIYLKWIVQPMNDMIDMSGAMADDINESMHADNYVSSFSTCPFS